MGQLVSLTSCTGINPTVTESDHQVNYLLNYRLQWGKPDRLSLLSSRLDNNDASTTPIANATQIPNTTKIPSEVPPYFTADTPSEYISIIMADWPYSGIYISSLTT